MASGITSREVRNSRRHLWRLRQAYSQNLKVEVGYLRNYQPERKSPNLSNHALRLQFLIDSKGLHTFLPAPG